MSEAYEGIVIAGTPAEASTAFHLFQTQLHLRLVHLPGRWSAVYRVAAAQDGFVPAEVEALAAQASRTTAGCLAVFYDNSCGVRTAVLFKAGQPVRVFGPADELWVPIHDGGEAVVGAQGVTVAHCRPGEEYDCCRNAVDLGLDALETPGASASVLKQACCYGDPAWHEESRE